MLGDTLSDSAAGLKEALKHYTETEKETFENFYPPELIDKVKKLISDLDDLRKEVDQAEYKASGDEE